MKRFIFGAVLVIVAGAAYLLNGSAAIDRMNPFLDIENHYAIIDNDGKEKEVTIDGVDKLQKGSYWHVLTRGNFLHDKVQVTIDKIPDGAKAKLGL
ncbi:MULTISPECIES: DUF1093 domain-containing protein [Bacillus]|uniref:DUF1093 domain-containing protein n=1 Tax=Bacillus TaxID=1386 RepID=UPI0002DDE88D|nr:MULTISPECIES: DUF1093 domain-containing protein [Bacillus]MBR9655354.1 DUF1093 domain-containing protein [Bacillus cereus]MCU5441408.1 DUF1093 domain-containing protein [Bacillus cereus]MCU5442470.1 DUF1093 domain-containing protein [Bacillus cereus]MEC4695400.1 DUF1093 domain-containing protein [Bacillus anthracis]OKA31908.1 IscU protein [Bacillus cereus]